MSELRAAKYIAALGKNVTLRPPGKNRAPDGDTSDLVVDGVNWDIITPETANARRAWDAILLKRNQARVVAVDLSGTRLRPSDFGDTAARLQGNGVSPEQFRVIFLPF